MDPVVTLTAFVLVAPVELPDKTFVATLVLATRYRPGWVWAGAGAAFGLQAAVAVALGGLAAQLPAEPVAAAAATLFAVGTVLLWRAAARPEPHGPEGTPTGTATGDTTGGTAGEEAGPLVATRRGPAALPSVAASFTVLFLAEWGDLSQLLTAGLAARSGDPVSTFVGAWAALLLVSGLGALVGRALLRRLRPAVLRRVGAVVCAVLAVVTFAQLVA
ncbi:MAG TPA: TMEM165/GDT1 family protein [Pseudonocardia sp.]|nr:TMEM165/GDT1 family protein [Pseudonocardia sp.]